MLCPCVVLFFGLAIVGLLAFYILPQFEIIFTELGLTLSGITPAVLAIGQIPPLIAGLAFAMLILLAFIVWILTRFSAAARWHGARILYHLPLIGTIVRSARLAAFADVLALLIEYEVPMPEAFRTAGRGSHEPLIAEETEQFAAELEKGMPLAQAISGSCRSGWPG